MTATVITGRPQQPTARALGWRRTTYELKVFFRDRQAVAFTLGFPVMLLVLFGAIFKGEVAGVPARQVMVPGLLASGVASVSFVSLAISIAIERDRGDLTRLALTPMPKAVYFFGKVGLVLVTAAAETVLVLAVGAVMLDLDLPADPARWWTFGWVMVLGVTACTLLGIAVSHVPCSGKSAATVVNLPFVALQFASGAYMIYSELPRWLQAVGALFPIKWMAQGFRSVLLPDSFQTVEPSGSWEHGRIALVLACWSVAAFALCVASFRWTNERVRS
jgi:ABC-2 type transport system permease protein